MAISRARMLKNKFANYANCDAFLKDVELIDGPHRKVYPLPIFVKHSEMISLANDIVKIYEIIRDFPNRVGFHDFDETLEYLGYEPNVRAILKSGCAGWTTIFGRADVIQHRGTYKVIEINTGSAIGGHRSAALTAAMAQRPSFKSFMHAHNIRYIDTISSLANTYRKLAAEVVGTEQPVVGIIEEEHSGEVLSWLTHELQNRGLVMAHGEIVDVDTRDDKVCLNGQPLDVAARHFFPSHLNVNNLVNSNLHKMISAHRNSSTAFHLPFDTEPYGSKAFLGMLFDPRFQRFLSDAEIRTIQHRLAWTRTLAVSDRVKPLFEFCISNKDSLVLKPNDQSNGEGIALGAECTRNEWGAILHDACSDGYVIQERARPALEYLDERKGLPGGSYAIQLQVHFNENGLSGVSARALDTSRESVVGHNDATSSASVVLC